MDDDISQKDFSGLSVQDMSFEEREEMRRRFKEFVQTIRGSATLRKAKNLQPREKMAKWTPRTVKKGN